MGEVSTMFSDRVQYQIGQRIRELRRSQDATQLQFSEDVYITPNFLSEIENGKKGLSCETLYNICETQKVSADYLLFGEMEPEKSKSDTIIETASGMNTSELDVVIRYLDALKKMREL